MNTRPAASRQIYALTFTVAVVAFLTSQLAQAADQTWTGGSGVNGNWSTLLNWNGGAAPGSTSLTTSTDVATFDAAIANTWGNTAGNPIIIDSPTQNIGGLVFTGAAGNYFIGTTGGNALKLSSGGTTQILSTLTATNAIETINVPLVIQGGGGSYTFSNNSANGSDVGAGTLNIGGAISGGAAGATMLNLSGSNTNNNTITGVIGNGAATSVSVTKSGSGTWVLTGNNTFTGTVTVNNGTLAANGANTPSSALGTASAIIINSGGTITAGSDNSLTGHGLAAGGQYVQINAGGTLANLGSSTNHLHALVMNGGTLSATTSNAFWGNWNFDHGVSTLGNGSTSLISGGNAVLTQAGGTIFNIGAGDVLNISTRLESVIEMSGTGLIKNGAGTLALSGANTYTEATTVNAGTLTLQNSNASPSYSIAGGATLEINTASNRDMSSATFSGAGTLLKTGDGQLRWTSAIATFSLGSGSLIDVQAGTFIGGNSANENWTSNLSSLNVAGGAIFDGVEANVRVNALTGSGTIRSGLSGAGYSTFTFGVDNGSGTFSGALTNSVHAGSFTKVGSGTQTLSGTNTYTGTTTVSAGTLKFAAAASLYNGSTASWTKTNINVNDGGTLAVNVGGTGEFTAGHVTTLLSNLTTSINNNGLRAGSTIAFDTTNAVGGTFTVSDTISNSTGTGAGSLGVTKLGTNTLVLTGANTYTGGSTITGGTVNVTNTTGSATGTGNVTVEASGTLSGTGIITTGSNNYIYVNGTLEVGDSTLTSPVASHLSLATSGTGSTVLGAGSLLNFDIFQRGGDLTGTVSAADYLALSGVLDSTLGGTLVLANANSLTGFASGDMWRLFDFVGMGSSITSDLALDYSALNLDPTLMGSFDRSSGIFSITAVVPEPSRALLLCTGLLGVLLRRQRRPSAPLRSLV